MGRAGRPRKAGKRNANGRLTFAPDRGNVVVQARSAAYARFQGGKADQQLHDQIGRVWAVGLLDGQPCDAAILRDAGRRYGQLYWHEFGQLAPRVGGSERKDRGAANDGGSEAAGMMFRVLDDLARAAGYRAVAEMHALCVDQWWFPDTNTPWVDRMLNGVIAARGGAVAGYLPERGDKARLEAAIEALLAMVKVGNHSGVRPLSTCA